MPAQAYPQPEVSDPDPVVDALDTGLLHWVKGETAEALKCLRQAREAADDAGQDHRALDLARASADLMPSVNTTPVSSPAASETSSTDPRRSRLPEPPAPSKKYAGAPTEEATTTSVAPTAKITTPRGSLSPVSPKASTSPPATSTTPASGRPTPPSTRPSASPAAAASGATALGLHGAATAQIATTAARSSTMPQPKTEPTKVEPETRDSTRSDTLDHRLASLRVRIDRVDSDGTVYAKLLDLAATASGQDNALLIVSQGVWQELKRGI